MTPHGRLWVTQNDNASVPVASRSSHLIPESAMSALEKATAAHQGVRPCEHKTLEVVAR